MVKYALKATLLAAHFGLRSFCYYSSKSDVACLNVADSGTERSVSNDPFSYVLHQGPFGQLSSMEIFGLARKVGNGWELPDVPAATGALKIVVGPNFESTQPEIIFNPRKRRITLMFSQETPVQFLCSGDSFAAGVDASDNVLRLDLLNVLDLAQYQAIQGVLKDF